MGTSLHKGAGTAAPGVKPPGTTGLEPIRLGSAERRKTRWIWILSFATVAILVASIALFAWEQNRVSDANATIAITKTELTVTQTEMTELGDQLAHMSSNVGRLHGELERTESLLVGHVVGARSPGS